jgi:hypothetical protein
MLKEEKMEEENEGKENNNKEEHAACFQSDQRLSASQCFPPMAFASYVYM